MKTIKAFTFAGSLAGILFIMAAFINMQNAKAVKSLQPQEDAKGFAVVELFTSEGCSSCPPADELIEKIRENNNGQIYILAFHVDYWDHQGWKDRFSDAEYSQRQRQYANWLNLRTVYTPQVVINGATEYIGSDQGPILRGISAGLEQQPSKALSLNSTIEGKKLNVTFTGTGAVKDTELVLALIQKSAQSNVKAGENTGRRLSHVQIVRKMQRFAINKKEITLKLPEDFNEKGWELIGFVQHRSNGQITAAGRFDFDTALTANK